MQKVLSRDVETTALTQYKRSTNLMWSSPHLVWTGKFALWSYYVPTVSILRQLRNHHDRFTSQGKGTFIPRCIRQHYVCSTFVRCLTRPLYVCIKFSLPPWHVHQLSTNTSPNFSRFHLCFNFYHEYTK